MACVISGQKFLELVLLPCSLFPTMMTGEISHDSLRDRAFTGHWVFEVFTAAYLANKCPYSYRCHESHKLCLSFFPSSVFTPCCCLVFSDGCYNSRNHFRVQSRRNNKEGWYQVHYSFLPRMQKKPENIFSRFPLPLLGQD